MSENIKDMTTGSPLRLIITFSLPLMIGNIFQQFYTVVDTMVVGKAVGVDALAALGATDWLYWMMLGMIQGITQGFGILMAREFGAKQLENLRNVIGCSLVLSAFFALLFLICGTMLSEFALKILNTPEEIMSRSLLYLRIMFLGIPVVMAYNFLATILRSLGDGRTPLNAMIVAALCNILLDLIFVLGFHWGIAGAAVATLIAQGVSSVYCLVKIWKIEFLKLKQLHFKEFPAMTSRLLGLGTPMAAQNAIIAVGGMIITAVVNGYGVTFIGGFTAANKLYGVLEIAATSYGYAMITYVGQNMGAMHFDRIKKGMRCSIAISLVTSAVITTIMLVFGKIIIGAFISGAPESAAEATKIGVRYLSIMSICLPALYILHVTRSAVQGMGNTVLPMGSGIAEFVMRTIGVLLLPFIMGQTGIFIAEVLAWFGADLILIPSYIITFKKIQNIDA